MQSVPFCSKKHIIRSDSRSGKEPQFSDYRTPTSFPAHPKGGEYRGLEDLQVRLQLHSREVREALDLQSQGPSHHLSHWDGVPLDLHRETQSLESRRDAGLWARTASTA